MTARSSEQTKGCRCAELTPAGRGAIATIAVWGAGAACVVTPWFRPARGGSLREVPCGRIVFGNWQANDGVTEELIVCRCDAETVEVHCHGGTAAARRVVRTLVAAGCVEVDQGDWIRTTQGDEIRADAYAALTAAPTQRTAAILLDQLNGEFSKAVNQVRNDLLTNRFEAAESRLAELRSWASLGLHLIAPWRVVLAGQPNTGKSSLINAILGYQRSIVHDQPGTTRDVLTAATAIDGWPIELTDTAGIRAGAQDHLETAGIQRAGSQVASADLVVWVTDVTTEWTSEEATAPVAAGNRPVLVVHNKSDLASPMPGKRTVGIRTSAVTGTGISELVAAIANHLVPAPPPPGTAMPFKPRHVESLALIGDALARNDTRAALAAINLLLADAVETPPGAP